MGREWAVDLEIRSGLRLWSWENVRLCVGNFEATYAGMVGVELVGRIGVRVPTEVIGVELDEVKGVIVPTSEEEVVFEVGKADVVAFVLGDAGKP